MTGGGGTAPTARSAGLTEGAGPVAAALGFVAVSEGPTVPEGPELGVEEGVAEVVATGGGKFRFTRSVRLLDELLFCA